MPYTKKSIKTGPRTGMTDKMIRYVEEYLVDANATHAAIRAGYSPKGANVTAARLMQHPLVKAAVAAAQDERSKRVGVDAEYVLLGAKECFERCMQREEVLDSKGKPTGEWKFDSAGATRALKIMGDHVNVNAFKALDEDGKPIDLNWKVTIVDAKPHPAKKT